MASKNLGQVEGLYIGISAPTNTALIWYDTSSHTHKVYDVALSAWTVLNQNSITAITYSALVSRAGGQGLTQGQWFKITDRSNALALAITGTKVQYVNNNGVPVVDDLGTHVSYNITSENLLIDESAGVYDASTNKLVFSFSETTPVMNTGSTDVDYVYGVQKRGNTKTQRKFRLSSFLSTMTGNDISWNGGFFLNFYNKLKSYFNVTGGVATHEALESYKTLNNQAIQQIGNNVTQAITQVGQNINNATTDAQIYGKQLPIAPTTGTPVDIAQNDTLQTIVQKVYRWIQKFKKADGIGMPSNYTPAGSAIPVTNTDNVSQAIGKLMKYAANHETGDGVKVSGSTLVPYSSAPSDIVNTDDLKTAINKLIYLVKNISTNQILDKNITERKLGLGTYPTDICRMDVEVSFPAATAAEAAILNNMSVGFCLCAGDGGFFMYDASDANNPYRIANGWIIAGSEDYPIISFSPVLPSQNNSEKDFSIAAPMLHYKGHWVENPWEGELPYQIGCYFQSQILLTQALYDDLYNLGYRYVRVQVKSVDVYDNTSIPISPNPKFIEMNRVNIWGFPVTVAQLNARSGRHMIVKIEVSFTTTNS